MAKIKKNRALKRKEIIDLLLKLNIPLPAKQDVDTLFTTLVDGKPPFPPPPGDGGK